MVFMNQLLFFPFLLYLILLSRFSSQEYCVYINIICNFILGLDLLFCFFLFFFFSSWVTRPMSIHFCEFHSCYSNLGFHLPLSYACLLTDYPSWNLFLPSLPPHFRILCLLRDPQELLRDQRIKYNHLCLLNWYLHNLPLFCPFILVSHCSSQTSHLAFLPCFFQPPCLCSC